MNRAPVCIAIRIFPERDREKPAAVAVAAAIGRTPVLADLDTMRPPRGVMLPFPPGVEDGDEADQQARRLARTAMAAGGTAVAFAAPHRADAAERWLRETMEGRAHG